MVTTGSGNINSAVATNTGGSCSNANNKSPIEKLNASTAILSLGGTGTISDDPFWGKRQADRLGKGQGINDAYMVNDREEVKINQQSYKMCFVMNKDNMLYKRLSLRKAKQVCILRFLTKICFLFQQIGLSLLNRHLTYSKIAVLQQSAVSLSESLMNDNICSYFLFSSF